jgi:hypothetical protein
MDDLTTLLHDAVSDVEPTDRLAAIREHTRPRRSHRWYAVGGAVLATAAVVTGVAIAVQPSNDPGPGPSHHPTAVDTPTPSGHVVAVYYSGKTPQGDRLFREFHQRTGAATLDEALGELSSPPLDPDYRTRWTAGQLLGATIQDDVIRVEIDPALTQGIDGVPLNDLALQQVIYTLQAAAGRRLPVQFVHDGNPVAEVDGLPTSEPLVEGDQLDVLALVNISDPSEGRVVEGSFSANGVASSFEGTVPWRLLDANGAVVLESSAQGTMEDHLTPWKTGPIDVTDLAPGIYVFEASTDDPSGGEGGGPTTDTRTITIR